MNPNDILNNLGGKPTEIITVDVVSTLLKLPVLVILLGNVLFAVLLLLRARILADTFDSPQNKIVKGVILVYLIGLIIGTLAGILFIAIG